MSPQTVTGVQTGWMLDSVQISQHVLTAEHRRHPARLTFHQYLLDLLAELLHGPLGQIVALLGLFQPLIDPSIGPQVSRARSRHV